VCGNDAFILLIIHFDSIADSFSLLTCSCGQRINCLHLYYTAKCPIVNGTLSFSDVKFKKSLPVRGAFSVCEQGCFGIGSEQFSL
jgi:hypothetical protein